MEVRIARRDAAGESTIDHITLGVPGEHGVVVLIDIDLQAAIGGTASEVLPGGELVITKNGVNYMVHPCAVRPKPGEKSSMFYFIGVPTDYVPLGP